MRATMCTGLFVINLTGKCKDNTRFLQIPPTQKENSKNELGYREREKSSARAEKLCLHQTNKTD